MQTTDIPAQMTGCHTHSSERKVTTSTRYVRMIDYLAFTNIIMYRWCMDGDNEAEIVLASAVEMERGAGAGSEDLEAKILARARNTVTSMLAWSTLNT